MQKQSGSPASLTAQLLGLLLRPIVRFALTRGLSVQACQQTLKEIFVQIAEEQILQSGETANDSRISVATGLARREVSRLRGGSDALEKVATQPLYARVLAQWEQDKRFRTRQGQPKALTVDGDDSDFAALVKTVSKHIKPGTVLFELQRNGAIDIKGDVAILKRPTVDTTVDHVKVYGVISRDIGDLLAAVEHNLSHDSSNQDVIMRTEYDNIYLAEVPGIRKWLVDEARAFHKRARDFISGHDKDVFPTGSESPAGGRVIVSMFSRSFCSEKSS